MWLFTRYGFFSIACASKPNGSLDPDSIMIRARKRGHLQYIQARFPQLMGELLTTAHSDYRYRLIVLKTLWAEVAAELAREQKWSNFKNEAAQFQKAGGSDYIHALHRVWEVMYKLQGSEVLHEE